MKICTLLFLLVSVAAFGGFRNKMNSQEYIYDFATSGGAASTIDLSAVSGKAKLPANAIIHDVRWKVLTALTSSANASVSVGNTTDADGYLPAVLYSTLASDVVSGTAQSAGALLWDDTNDNYKSFLADGANDRDFSITFTGAVTAGKVLFYVEYYMPSED